ncbi:MAG TPA: ABC transporter substrate-binding protein [Actinomycetota bacterium]|nr:ABC transporter substrate-binding protein [Actinomycetota bacterium]
MAGTDRPDGPRRDDAPSDVQIRTFLIADVRGYTLFTQERGDEAAAKLAAKFADIVREVVEARGGTLLELRGDEALCVFASAREAIRTTVDLQQRFVEETLEQPELPLTVGIGLDAGEAVEVQGGYRGGALNLAARLCGQARAGEILASREVTHLARRIDGVRYEDRGSLTFKGISDPIAVARVVPEGADPAERLRPFAPPAPPSAKGRRPWALIGAIVVVLALVAISIPLLTSGGDAAVEIGTNSVARMNPDDGSVRLTGELGQRPGASAVGFGSLWVAQPDRGVVARLALDTGSVTDTIRVGNAPSGVAVGAGAVWVTNAGDGTVSRIDPGTNEESQRLAAGASPTGIAVGDGVLWVADSIGGALLRVDPTTQEVVEVALAGLPSGVTFTPDGVWVSVAPNSVARVDPTGMSLVFTTQVGSGPTSVVSSFGSVWVANHLDGTVARLEPSTGRVEATIPVGQGPNALAAAGGSLWVGNELEDSVVAIDPSTNDVVQTVAVGAAAASLTADGEGLWLAVGTSATEHRGGTLTVSAVERAPDSLDPAIVYDSEGWRILTITNDALLAYKKVGGPDGATLVPDLASALPDVSPDGLTYRFPLRQGITYSTGEPIRPEDYRRAVERALALHQAGYLLSAIEGADTCLVEAAGAAETESAPPDCDLSRGISVDEEAVTFHLARPDPDLPFKLALPFAFPVPADTPAEDQGLDPLPATGPYLVTDAGREGVELERNPAFEEWSAAAQPDGFVDAITWRFGESSADAFRRLQDGDLDVMIGGPEPEDLATLRSTDPDQVLSEAGPFTLFIGFDTVKPPFDDERVRRAVSYAIDREHLVDLLGGPTTQHQTCQILPPNYQGYEPYCPFTLEPDNLVWSAPDMDRAKALVEEAGAVGTPVDVLAVDEGLQPGAVEAMTYVADVLTEIGLEPELEILHSATAYFGRILPPAGGAPGTPAGTPRHPHVFLSGWIADYLGARNFIEPQFACGEAGFANGHGWCDATLEDRMDEAAALQVTDPGAANRAWREIEHQLVDAAVQAPITNPLLTHAVSDRAENVQLHPQWGLMLSLIWVQ